MGRPAHEIAADIMHCFDDETGEIDADALDALHDEMGDKIEAIGYLVRQRAAWAAGAKAESVRQLERVAAFNRDSDRLTARAQALLGIMGSTRHVTATGTASIHKGRKSTVIDDDAVVPERFKSEVVSVKVDKKAIAAAIDGGEEVPGAHRETSEPKLHWK